MARETLNASDGRPVSLPALPAPSTDPVRLLAFMQAVKEWLEVSS
jgi:hypothetical protein